MTVRAKIAWPHLVDLIPERECRSARVEHFSISPKEAGLSSLRAALNGHPTSVVPPGRYARLLVDSEVMMTDTLMEKKSNTRLIEMAKGHVLIGGLGLGMILRIFSPSSSGLWRVSRLNKALDSLREGRIPDLSFPQWQDANSTWAAAGCKFAEYVKTLHPTETPALLLDEPERSLSISNAIKLFHKVLLVTGSLVQVFVATHSPFALDLTAPHVHIVDMQEGYADECRASLRAICHGFSERKKG